LRYSQDKTGYVHQRALFQDQENALSPSGTSDKKKKKDNALSDHGFYSIIVLFGPHGLGTRLNISKNCKALTIYIYI
jgi:hypothetical protein